MPVYVYSCRTGHLTERFFPVASRRLWVVCRCRKRANRDFGAEKGGGGLQLSPDVPEHWNVTVDKVVRSRKHLRDLQKRHGFQDYEPVRPKFENYGSPPEVHLTDAPNVIGKLL